MAHLNKKTRKYKDGSVAWQFYLCASLGWENGRPKNKTLGYLATFDLSKAKDANARKLFWRQVREKLEAHNLSPEQRAEVEKKLAAHVPPQGKMAALLSSQSDEHYTPPEVLEKVIAVLEEIDFDPCSDPGLNVPAKRHYTAEENGLGCFWYGRVFLNPPYGRAVGRWTSKLVQEFQAGNVTEAIALVAARPGSKWFQALLDFPVCYWRGRIKFLGNPDPAPFDSALFYLGDRPQKFAEIFGTAGKVLVPSK